MRGFLNNCSNGKIQAVLLDRSSNSEELPSNDEEKSNGDQLLVEWPQDQDASDVCESKEAYEDDVSSKCRYISSYEDDKSSTASSFKTINNNRLLAVSCYRFHPIC